MYFKNCCLFYADGTFISHFCPLLYYKEFLRSKFSSEIKIGSTIPSHYKWDRDYDIGCLFFFIEFSLKQSFKLLAFLKSSLAVNVQTYTDTLKLTS